MIIEKLRKNICNYFGDNIVTLSGEIIITTLIGKPRITLNNIDRSEIKKEINNLKDCFEFLTVEVINGLTEINIKLFTHNARLSSSNFLDELNESLIKLVRSITKQGNYTVRLNVFGKYYTKDKIVEYRYLNKEDDVRYMIVDEDKQQAIYRLSSPKFVLLIGTLIILCLGGYRVYQYFNSEKQVPAIEQQIKNTEAAEHSNKV